MKKDISTSIEELRSNLNEVARVEEWARLMGYRCPKQFARTFLKYYSIRPRTVLKYIRLRSIVRHLKEEEISNFEIARQHGIPDEIALNKYINYHLDCSPTSLREMPEELLYRKIEKFGSKVR